MSVGSALALKFHPGRRINRALRNSELNRLPTKYIKIQQKHEQIYRMRQYRKMENKTVRI